MALHSSLESNFLSMKTVVEFLNVQDQYCYNEDLSCAYRFNHYSPQEGDRLAIFKLGWNFVKDYVVFEWVPVEIESDEGIHKVVFNKHVLPKNNVDMYQICYLSGENELYGASSLFQFSHEKNFPVPMTTPSTFTEDAKHQIILQANSESEAMIKSLKKENARLLSTLKCVVSLKNEPSQNYDQDICELRQITESLKKSLDLQQREINMLESKISECGEEYKKLYIGKCKIEKKYEQLKSKKDDKSQAFNSKVATDLMNFNIDELRSIPPFPYLNPQMRDTSMSDILFPNTK